MTSRLAALTAAVGLVLTLLVATAPGASAAWGSVITIHGARLQVCKVPLGDGRQRLKVRLDNTRGGHTHLGGISRTRNGQRQDVDLRAAAGRVSQVRSLVWRRGDELSGGIGEVTGEGAGGGFSPGDVPRC
jgi:hypothetical protein